MYTSLEPDVAPGLSADVSQDLSGRVLVEVRKVSGKVQAVLPVGPEETVRRLKSRVLEMDSGADLGKRHFKLVHDCTPLPESRMLRDCVGPAGWSACCEAQRSLRLTMVLPSISSLAACVQVLGLESGGESVMDVADSVWQAEHALAAKHQPTAAEVAVGMPHETRVQVVEWLGMACEATLVDEALLHGAVLTLDRFAATASEAVDRSVLLRLSLASLATEMKLTSEEDFPSGHWQRVLLHLSQGGETLPNILDTEARMLRRLGFVVGVPTPLSFLSGLSLRLAAPCAPGVPAGHPSCGPCPATPRAALQTALARLLVELALHDLQLAYRYPPALLAAGALGAALLVVGPEERTDEKWASWRHFGAITTRSWTTCTATLHTSTVLRRWSSRVSAICWSCGGTARADAAGCRAASPRFASATSGRGGTRMCREAQVARSQRRSCPCSRSWASAASASCLETVHLCWCPWGRSRHFSLQWPETASVQQHDLIASARGALQALPLVFHIRKVPTGHFLQLVS